MITIQYRTKESNQYFSAPGWFRTCVQLKTCTYDLRMYWALSKMEKAAVYLSWCLVVHVVTHLGCQDHACMDASTDRYDMRHQIWQSHEIAVLKETLVSFIYLHSSHVETPTVTSSWVIRQFTMLSSVIAHNVNRVRTTQIDKGKWSKIILKA